MLKKILSVIVVLAICLTIGTVMPLVDAADGTEKLDFEGEGKESSPYLIKTASDLKQLAEIVNGGNDCSGIYFKMTDDIDLSSVCGRDIDGAEVSWTPIGANIDSGSAFLGTDFSGVFDGDGHEISNLYIRASKGNYHGLFGRISGAVVKNLIVGGSVSNSIPKYSYDDGHIFGGIVGCSVGSTIDSCINTVSVSGWDSIGGVVGLNYSSEGSGTATVVNCRNMGAISGNFYAGGVVGQNQSDPGGTVIVKECCNNGRVSCRSYTGGVVGYNYVTEGTVIVKNCYNTGEITGREAIAGGIEGGNEAVTNGTGIVLSCYNIGKVSSSYEPGGIVGRNNSLFRLENCYNLESATSRAVGNFNGSATNLDESSFASGEVAYLLQSGQEDDSGLVWGQRLTAEGEHDDSPILTNNEAYRVLKATFIYNDSSAIKYANPNASFAPPTEDLEGLPEPEEGYVLGWTTDPDGETAEYYGTVTIGTEDITFYAVFAAPKLPDPEYESPKVRELVYDTQYLETGQELIIPGSATNGTMMYKLVEYREIDDFLLFPAEDDYNGYSEEVIPTGTDAGVYTVGYMVKGYDGYNDIEPQYLTVIIDKATPVPPKTDLHATVGQRLADIESQLPEGYKWVNNELSVGDVGENSFDATFSMKDTKNYNTVSLKLTVKVTEPGQEPAPELPDPEYKSPTAREDLVYDTQYLETGQNLIIPGSATNGTMMYKLVEYREIDDLLLFSSADGLDNYDGYSADDIPTGADAGIYRVGYMVKGNDGYNDIEPQYLTVTIAKADPVPPKTDLHATVGQRLADIESQLPEGYKWVNNELSVGDVGENSFDATFSMKDTKNYNTVNLKLTVKVTEPEKPAETTTTTATVTAPPITTTTAAITPVVTTTTTAAPVMTTTTTAAPVVTTTTTTTPAETTTTTTTTPPEITTEPPSTTSPPPAVTKPKDEDRSPNTGIVLVVAPLVAASITVVVSRKRK